MWRCYCRAMNQEKIFSTWAPDESPWSCWAKPVLFAYLDSAASEISIAEATADMNWAPLANERVALILDLPGAEGISTGLSLAARGYRPVPLYNAVPLPTGDT